MRFSALLFLVLVLGCRREAPRYQEVNYGAAEREAHFRTLWFPVYYPLEELEDWLNRKFDRVIADTYVPFKGDSLLFTVKKPGRIGLFVAGNSVDVVFPLEIEITEDREGKDGRKIYRQVSGGLTLYFNIRPNVSSEWEILTTTTFQGYNWTRRPRLEIGGFKLGVKFIADYLLRNELEDLPQQLDEVLREKVNLKNAIGRTWYKLQKPFPLYAADSTTLWFKIDPDQLWGDIHVGRKGLLFQLAVNTRALVHSDSTRFSSYRPLPDFQPLATMQPDSNRLEVRVAIPLQVVNHVLKRLAGEFRGPRVISDIKIRGLGQKLALDLQVAGSSTITVVGTPQYDRHQGTLLITRPDYDLESEHKVLNAVDKRFREEILRYLDKKVLLDIRAYADNLPQFLNSTLNEGNHANQFELYFSSIEVENMYHATEQSELLIWFSCKPQFEITLKKLPAKKKVRI